MKLFELLDSIDQHVFNRMKQFEPSSTVRSLMKFYTRLGDGYIWGGAILYLGLKMGWSEFFSSLKLISLAIVLSIGLYWIIKLRVRRQRPFAVMDSIKAEVPPMDQFSFPSGHTMNNLGVGIIVGSQHPELLWASVGFPVTWGFLRVYFGVHYFTDIIAGIALGGLCAYLTLVFGPNILDFFLS